MSGTTLYPFVGSLRRLLVKSEPPPHERCELCGDPIAGEHAHVVDVANRRLLCTCEGCRWTGGRYQAVPSRYVHMPSVRIPADTWDPLGVPVDLVFFFFNSALSRVVASYPGAAGVVEALVQADAWQALTTAHPTIGAIAADTEAVLIRRTGDDAELFVVPIDTAYELVGVVRSTWTGLDGGVQLREALDVFFGRLRARARLQTSSRTAGRTPRGSEVA